jgi:hypothetical protein
MKTRIILTIASLLAWGWLSRALFTPATAIAKNYAVVNTVNGGDSAYIAQQALDASTNTASIVYALVLVGVLISIWAAPVKHIFAAE